ncbi:unnamed protein product [Linum trigynum]|uniref:Secreted protein n=1 Tax=Linum trigynum TaxID=586398 RepID=A0AAV2G7Q8_9ROSI
MMVMAIPSWASISLTSVVREKGRDDDGRLREVVVCVAAVRTTAGEDASADCCCGAGYCSREAGGFFPIPFTLMLF